MIASDAERIEEAFRLKHRLGGAMRQAGIVAAAALYALDHHVERLAEDHARARHLAEGLAAAGLPVAVDAVETNFVGLELEPLGLTGAEAKQLLKGEGILVSDLRPGVLRIATYLGITDEDVDAAVERMPAALGARV